MPRTCFRSVPGPRSAAHNAEIAAFEQYVSSEVTFQWSTNQEAFKRVQLGVGEPHLPYIEYLRLRNFPHRD